MSQPLRHPSRRQQPSATEVLLAPTLSRGIPPPRRSALSPWLLAIPTGGTYLATWAYTTQRRRHEGLDFLYRSTQLLHQSSDLEAALAELLRHTCETFNAASAELVYITETDDRPVCVRVRPDDTAEAPALQGGDLDHPALQAVLCNTEARIVRCK